MNALRWISLALWIVMLVTWVTWYVKYVKGGRERPSRWKAFGVLLLVFLLQSLADFFPNTAVGWALLVLSLLTAIWCGVLMVREVRVTWREQMERVKHL